MLVCLGTRAPGVGRGGPGALMTWRTYFWRAGQGQVGFPNLVGACVRALPHGADVECTSPLGAGITFPALLSWANMRPQYAHGPQHSRTLQGRGLKVRVMGQSLLAAKLAAREQGKHIPFHRVLRTEGAGAAGAPTVGALPEFRTQK